MTGQDVMSLIDPRRATMWFWVTIFSLWSSKRQNTFFRSSVEAKYRGMENVVVELCWLRNLLCELHLTLQRVTLVSWTMSMQCICLFNTNRPNISNSIFILFVTKLPWGKSGSFTCLHRLRHFPQEFTVNYVPWFSV